MPKQTPPADPLAEALKAVGATPPEADPVEHIASDPPPRLAAAAPAIEAVEDDDDSVAQVAAALDDLLTDEDIARAREKARKRFIDEEKRSRLKAIEDDELEKLRMAQGLVTGERVKDELVWITMNLAEHSDCVRVNGREFWHAQTYKVTRAQADTLRDIIYRGWRHQDEVEGHDLESHYRRAQSTIASGTHGLRNAPNTALLAEFRH